MVDLTIVDIIETMLLLTITIVVLTIEDLTLVTTVGEAMLLSQTISITLAATPTLLVHH
jgi:hypothetical protein